MQHDQTLQYVICWRQNKATGVNAVESAVYPYHEASKIAHERNLADRQGIYYWIEPVDKNANADTGG